MTDIRYRIKKLEKDNGDGSIPFVVLFHDEYGVFRSKDGTVHTHEEGDYWHNSATGEIVMSTIFTVESLRSRL